MTKDPKSIWYVTPNANRIRKIVAFTLSDSARLRLERLAKLHEMSKSEVVEALIIGAPTLNDDE